MPPIRLTAPATTRKARTPAPVAAPVAPLDEAAAVEMASRAAYPGIDFSPPQGVRDACARGVELYEEDHGGDGLVDDTIAWARRLARGEDATPEKLVKMRAWHARHAVDRREGWDAPPTPGYVAFMLWGGAPGEAWSGKMVERMEAADAKRVARAALAAAGDPTGGDAADAQGGAVPVVPMVGGSGLRKVPGNPGIAPAPPPSNPRYEDPRDAISRGDTPTDQSYTPHGAPRNTPRTDRDPPPPSNPRQADPADPRPRNAPRHPGLVGAPQPASSVDTGGISGTGGDAAEPSAGYVPTPTTEAAQGTLDAQGAEAEARRVESLRRRAGEALGIPPEAGAGEGDYGDVALQEAMADESLAPVTDADGRISPYAETVRRDAPDTAENLANAGVLDPTPVQPPENRSGVAVVLTIPRDVAEGLAVPQGLPASELHVTLLYLGQVADQPDGRGPALVSVLRALSAGLVPPAVRVSGVGRFVGGVDADDVTRPDVLYLSLDSPDLDRTRAAVVAACASVGAFNASEHGFTPHMTVAYLPPGVERPDVRPRAVEFDGEGLALWWGSARYSFRYERNAASGAAFDALAYSPLQPQETPPPGSLSTGGVALASGAPGVTPEAPAPPTPPADLPEGAVLPFRVVPLDVRGDSMAYADATPWNREHALGRLRAWASSDGTGAWDTVDLARYVRAFAYVDAPRVTGAAKTLRYSASGFRFPHHDVYAGRLTLSRAGLLRACVSLMAAMNPRAPETPRPADTSGPSAPMLPSPGAAGPPDPEASGQPRAVPSSAGAGASRGPSTVTLRDLAALGYPATDDAVIRLGAMAPPVRLIPSSGDAATTPIIITDADAEADAVDHVHPAPGGIPMSDLEATREHLARHCDQLGVTPPWALTVVRPAEATEMRADFVTRATGHAQGAAAGVTTLDTRAGGDVAVAAVPGATLGPEVVAVSWIQVAKLGEFRGHTAGNFRFTPEVFAEIIANFRATANRAVPVDYEHTTERMDGTIPLHGAPAVGFITDLQVRGANAADGLWGKVEWVDTTAVEYVRSKRYRFFSPAVVFDATHPASGKDIGAALVSGGLTNRPFLDGMAPITARAVSTHQPPLQPRDREAVEGDGTPAAWDADAGERDLRRWASEGGTGAKVDMDWTRYREGFAWFNADAPEDFGSYKLPHHVVIDGALRTSRRGVEAAIAALNGARGGVSIPVDEREDVYRHLANHYKLWEGEAPALMSVSADAAACRITPAEIEARGVAAMVASARAYLDPAAASERVAALVSMAAERLGVTGVAAPAAPPAAIPAASAPVQAVDAAEPQSAVDAAAVVTVADGAGTPSATTMRDTTGTNRSERSIRLRAAVTAFRAGERTALMRWYDGIDDVEDLSEALRCYLNLPALATIEDVREGLSRLADLVASDMGERDGVRDEVMNIVGCLRRALNLPALALPADVVGYVMALVDAIDGSAAQPLSAYATGGNYLTEMRAKWMARKAAMNTPTEPGMGGVVGHDGDDAGDTAAEAADGGTGNDAPGQPPVTPMAPKHTLDAGAVGPGPSAVHTDGAMGAEMLNPNPTMNGATSAGAHAMSTTTPSTPDTSALAAENAALRARLDVLDRRDAEAAVDHLITCGFVPAAGRAGAIALRLSAGPDAFAAMYPAEAVQAAVTMRATQAAPAPTPAPAPAAAPLVSANTAAALMAPPGAPVAMRSEAPSVGTTGAVNQGPMDRHASRAAVAMRANALRAADPSLHVRDAFERATAEIAAEGHALI